MKRPSNKFKYFALNKPYGVLSQFSDSEGRKTLKNLYDFPPDVYPVGRLDKDSEGLLLLSNDTSLVNFLLNPKHKHEKEYYVQVEKVPDETALNELRKGVIIEQKKTLPAKAELIADPRFPEREPPIRRRNNIPTAWISLTITEGRNRQVRKMTAAVGYPTLRLVRIRIKNIKLNDLKPGKVHKLSEAEIKELKRFDIS
jgi:23S rRNA pseudouridine2457 synthase